MKSFQNKEGVLENFWGYQGFFAPFTRRLHAKNGRYPKNFHIPQRSLNSVRLRDSKTHNKFLKFALLVGI